MQFNKEICTTASVNNMHMKPSTRMFLALFILLFTALMVAEKVFAAANAKPLPADQAFVLDVTMSNQDTVNVRWHIVPGYYLYRQRMHFNIEPKAIADIRLPQGEIKQGLNHSYEIYSGNVSIPIVFHTQNKQLQLGIDYQGCSEGGFCYPPEHKTITLNLGGQATVQDISANNASSAASSSFQTLLTDQNGVRNLLGTHDLGVMLLIFLGMGFLLAFTPCVLPMIPILTSIIVGHKQPVTTGKAFLLSSTYVLGSSITYAIAGIIAAMMGHSLQAWLQQPWIIACVSGLFVVLAFSLFGLYDLRLPRNLQNRITALSRKQESGTYAGVFIMGIVSTLIVSPCVTAPLVGVLMYIAESGNMILGAGALFAMSIGMGIPLILIGMTTGKWLPRRGPWMNAVQKIFGVLMLGMAVWMLTRISSATVIIVFCGVMLIGAALFFGVYLPRQAGQQRFNRRLGMAAGIAGLLLLAAGFTMPSIMNSLARIGNPAVANSFIVVHSVADLKKQLSIAQTSHKPVLLDFYADWCESCVVMDKNVFNQPEVKNALNRFVLLRADLSANTSDDETLLKNYDVIAPPTVIFFNNAGQEVNSRRIVGELNAQDFMTRINTFITESCD